MKMTTAPALAYHTVPSDFGRIFRASVLPCPISLNLADSF